MSMNLIGNFGPIRQNKEKYFEEFKKCYDQGMNDCEIARYLGMCGSGITQWRKRLGWPKNFKYKRKFDTNKFKELYDKGYNWAQISRELGVSQSAIRSYGESLNLSSHFYDVSDLTLTYEEEQVLIGSIYGDGYLGFSKDSINAHFMFAHSLKQQNYALWKYEMLKRLCVKPKLDTEYDKRQGNTYYRISVRSTVFPVLSKLYPYFYRERKKYINPEMLYKLDGLGLAIWFQDDGYYCHESYAFSTNCYSVEDLNIIKEFFETKYDIHGRIHANHVFRILKRDAEKLRNLILPYMNEDCMYKLHLDPNKTPLTGESLYDDAVLKLREIEEMPND